MIIRRVPKNSAIHAERYFDEERKADPIERDKPGGQCFESVAVRLDKLDMPIIFAPLLVSRS